jgi:hypothetical protein
MLLIGIASTMTIQTILLVIPTGLNVVNPKVLITNEN